MGGLENYDGPEEREAPDVAAVVEVIGHAGRSVEGPVKAREAWGHVVKRGGIGEAGAGWAGS